MTKNDIIGAAFKVWGRELYRTTSLMDIAKELGVSKPALYRHFKNKNALIEAMYTTFFDNYTVYIKAGYEEALSAGNRQEAWLILMRIITEYYIRNKDAFIFCLVQVYGGSEIKYMGSELKKRGIDMRRLILKGDKEPYPSEIQLVTVTLIYYISAFHQSRLTRENSITEETVKTELSGIEDRIVKGLRLDAEKVAAIDYERLEQQVINALPEITEENSLLKAVAEAVARAGPWNVSMDMVAKRSGLSKSGLYAHFKNKQDMLAQFFITEFTRIANYTKTQIETVEASEEQLYLVIISIMNYLKSRPEILVSIDWIRTRRLDLGKEIPGRLYDIIGTIKMEIIRNFDRNILVSLAQWILFLIVNTLLWWPSPKTGTPSVAENFNNRIWAKNAAEIPAESLRVLFRFIARGLEGLS